MSVLLDYEVPNNGDLYSVKFIEGAYGPYWYVSKKVKEDEFGRQTFSSEGVSERERKLAIDHILEYLRGVGENPEKYKTETKRA